MQFAGEFEAFALAGVGDGAPSALVEAAQIAAEADGAAREEGQEEGEDDAALVQPHRCRDHGDAECGAQSGGRPGPRYVLRRAYQQEQQAQRLQQAPAGERRCHGREEGQCRHPGGEHRGTRAPGQRRGAGRQQQRDGCHEARDRPPPDTVPFEPGGALDADRVEQPQQRHDHRQRGEGGAAGQPGKGRLIVSISHVSHASRVAYASRVSYVSHISYVSQISVSHNWQRRGGSCRTTSAERTTRRWRTGRSAEATSLARDPCWRT